MSLKPRVMPSSASANIVLLQVKGNLRVVGTFAAAPLRSVNAAGVVNTCGNRALD